MKSWYQRLPFSSRTSFSIKSISPAKSGLPSWLCKTICGSRNQTSNAACFQGVVSPSSISPLYKTVKCCHGASPSEIWSMVSYKSSLLLNGGSTSGGTAAAQICSRSLMLLAGICSQQKMRSASSNTTRFSKGEKLLGSGSSLGGGGAPSGRNSPSISQGKP